MRLNWQLKHSTKHYKHRQHRLTANAHMHARTHAYTTHTRIHHTHTHTNKHTHWHTHISLRHTGLYFSFDKQTNTLKLTTHVRSIGRNYNCIIINLQVYLWVFVSIIIIMWPTPRNQNMCRLLVFRTRLKPEVTSFRRKWTLSCDLALHIKETLKCLPSLPILMQHHSGGDSIMLGIAPASPTSWDLGPHLHIYMLRCRRDVKLQKKSCRKMMSKWQWLSCACR